MPTWVLVMLATASALTASGVIWTKGIKPLAEIIVLLQQAVPLLRDLSKNLGDVPTPFNVLEEIIAQFRTNGGSSLRDVVNRLEEATQDSNSSVRRLEVQVEAQRILAIQDRQEFLRLIIELDRFATKTAREQERVRANLSIAQTAVDGVATDLVAAHTRADLTEGVPGEASDAASRSPTE